MAKHSFIDIVDTSATMMNISSMSLRNFMLVFMNKTVVKDNLNQVLQKVSMDSNYKLYRLKDENKKPQKTVLTFISIETDKLNPVIAFAMLSNFFTAIHLRIMYESITQCLVRFLPAASAVDFVWKPLWMIDKCATEIAFMQQRQQKFIICKFHAINIWWDWINLCVHDETYKKEIRKAFYDLYNCNSKEEYLKVYEEFIANEFIPQDFKLYYNCNWHEKGEFEIEDKQVPFYYFWTSILRDSNFGSYSTNNINEIKFAALGKSVKSPHHKYFNRLNTSKSSLLLFMNHIKEDMDKTRWQKYNKNPEVKKMNKI